MKNVKVFISYSHTDSQIVSPIVSIMKVMSDRVFRDVEHIKPGEKWEMCIETALENMQTLMLFWCLHSSKSDYVRKEYSYAIDNDRKIVPVLLDTTEVPPMLKEYQWIDLSEVVSSFHSNCKETNSWSLTLHGRKNGGQLDSVKLTDSGAFSRALLNDISAINKIESLVTAVTGVSEIAGNYSMVSHSVKKCMADMKREYNRANNLGRGE